MRLSHLVEDGLLHEREQCTWYWYSPPDFAKAAQPSPALLATVALSKAKLLIEIYSE